MAAARKVSAAHSSTLRCSARHGALGGLQNFQQVLADQPFDFGRVANHAAIHTLTDALQNFTGGAYPDIGTDQRELQLVEQIGVDLLGALQHVLEPRHQPGARLLHAALQAFQQRRLLLHRSE